MTTHRFLCLRVLVVLGCFLLMGCTSAPNDVELRKYVLAVDEWGDPLDPGAGLRPSNITKFDTQLAGIFQNIHDWQQAGEKDPKGPKRNRIVIFVHGGMNTQSEALERAEDRYDDILKEGVYPIFINWNSAPFSSYGEHLFAVRQGIVQKPNYLTAPVYFLADLVRAVGRAPIVWFGSVSHDLHLFYAAIEASKFKNQDRRFTDNPDEYESVVVTAYLDKLQRKARAQQPPQDVIDVKFGTYIGEGNIPLGEVIQYSLLYAPRLLVAPLLDALGKAAWDNMCRRTTVMFDGKSANYLKDKILPGETVVSPGKGTLVRFLDSLGEFQKNDMTHCEITLVGHSMGAIVLDELVRRSLEPEHPIYYTNIVYLAAACSVHDFQRCVIPYMVNQIDPAHPTTQPTEFYNLCLYPVNDLRERVYEDLIPRGSLLVWIDDFLSEPRTPLDRTMGRWDNIVQATFVIPATIYKHVHLKAFSFMRTDDLFDHNPQQHTHFTDDEISFWDPKFWNSPSPGTDAENPVPPFIHQRAAEITGP